MLLGRMLLVIVALTLLIHAPILAIVKPHNLFSNNAVLQQGISLPIWGTADNGERVTVKFDGQTVSTTAKNGEWMVRLKPLRSGGPFTMTIKGENTVEITNVLVGEVWICSGQSNMQWPVSQTVSAQETIAASSDPMLRLFTVPHTTQDAPARNVVGSWNECGPATVSEFSAVGYFFGRDLRKALNFPIGLINSSWGGTRVEAWTSKRALDPDPDIDKSIKALPDWAKSPNRSSVLYNGMIAPLIPYGIRGAIWYQGESNAGDAQRYRSRFPAMIRNWREDWGQGDFPFLFVQLAPFQAGKLDSSRSAWAELREAQLHTSLTCPKTAMAVITDVGECDNIHPKDKAPVGARLALAARAIAYDENVPYRGPLFKNMAVWNDRAVLTFTDAYGGLQAKGGELNGFAIAGPDGAFSPARATIQGDRVVVSSDAVPNPAAVRYGWADCPTVNLFNKAGLPASPFRTDGFLADFGVSSVDHRERMD